MTEREKKILTGIITWSLVILAVVTTTLTYRKALAHYEQAIIHKKEQILYLKRQVANKPALTKAVTDINQLIDQSDLFIRTPDRQAADAELLSRAKKIIETAGGKIRSVAPVNHRRNKANNSRVNISLSASQEALVEIIKNMGASKPLMNITQANLATIWAGSGQKRTETGDVRIQIQVEAFYALGVASQ